jgi:hypothetical protein
MLLFQWKFLVNGRPETRRLCEQRILNFDARDAWSALREARRRGRAAQYWSTNTSGQRFYFQFIGVLDLLTLGVECDESEVWYDIMTLVKPMERRQQLVPAPSHLSAMNPKARRPNRPLQPTRRAARVTRKRRSDVPRG